MKRGLEWRKAKWCVNSFLINISEDKILGNKTSGRPRTAFLRSSINTIEIESHGLMKKPPMATGRQGMPLGSKKKIV